jgi:hypothetical protein
MLLNVLTSVNPCSASRCAKLPRVTPLGGNRHPTPPVRCPRRLASSNFEYPFSNHIHTRAHIHRYSFQCSNIHT